MTAEAALVLPVLAAVTLALVWMLGLAVAQMRVTDAAREAARAIARGDSTVEAERAARVAAPGASVRVASGSSSVSVTVEDVIRPPGDLLGDLGAVHVQSTAVALSEGASGG